MKTEARLIIQQKAIGQFADGVPTEIYEDIWWYIMGYSLRHPRRTTVKDVVERELATGRLQT